MMSYPERIARVLINAPPPPPLRRKPSADDRRLGDETRARLIMVHTVSATFEGGTHRQNQMQKVLM